METILAHAQGLVYTLLAMMPTVYQRDNLQALLGLFLEAQGHPLPQYSQAKSASALSRFLNRYNWPTRKVIRLVRQQTLKQILAASRRGRRPTLQVLIDLTTLEKRGKFKELKDLVRVYHSKRGLHLVVLYLVLGQWRVPWNFRVYRGKGIPSPAQLGLRLLRSLPKSLTDHFEILVLADTAFGSIAFLEGVRALKFQAITGIRSDRKLRDGGRVSWLRTRGQQVYLFGLTPSVHVSWYWLKREGGKREKRFVISTKPLKGTTISRWGRCRWQIEGWFKTAKHRFGLHRFGQISLRGVYRWLVLSMLAFLLAHWAYLLSGTTHLPDWGHSARLALESFLPQLVVLLLLLAVDRLKPLLQSQGFELQISSCKI